MDVCFAHPHAAWQRGANEQVNACYATTSPKEQTTVKSPPERLQEAVTLINQRPRKSPGYRTPCDLFADGLRVALAA
jgi:transposase, IS30 family